MLDLCFLLRSVSSVNKEFNALAENLDGQDSSGHWRCSFQDVCTCSCGGSYHLITPSGAVVPRFRVGRLFY